jgi:hypothetical protein
VSARVHFTIVGIVTTLHYTPSPLLKSWPCLSASIWISEQDLHLLVSATLPAARMRSACSHYAGQGNERDCESLAYAGTNDATTDRSRDNEPQLAALRKEDAKIERQTAWAHVPLWSFVRLPEFHGDCMTARRQRVTISAWFRRTGAVAALIARALRSIAVTFGGSIRFFLCTIGYC